jgi:hypothetical protein
MIPNSRIAEEMAKWIREQREWLENEGWQRIRKYVEHVYRVDSLIVAEKGLIPTLHIPLLCYHEKKIGWAIAVMNIPIDIIRENFGSIWKEIVADIVLKRTCPRCGHRLLPLGYVFCSEAWMVRSNRLLDIPPSEHPDREEVYIVLVNTIFGKLAIARAPIVNRRVGELEWNEECEGAVGNFVLPLPKLEDLERWLKDQAESEKTMYG